MVGADDKCPREGQTRSERFEQASPQQNIMGKALKAERVGAKWHVKRAEQGFSLPWVLHKLNWNHCQMCACVQEK